MGGSDESGLKHVAEELGVSRSLLLCRRSVPVQSSCCFRYVTLVAVVLYVVRFMLLKMFVFY